MNQVSIVNIEKAVLSSILFEHMIIVDILEILKPKDFYLPVHQKIFETMIELNNEDFPIDEEFIKKRAGSSVNEKDLIEILSTNPITNVKVYIKEIKEQSIKRELASHTLFIKKTLEDDNVNASDCLDKVQQNLYSISNDSVGSELKDMDTVLDSTIEMMKAMNKLSNTYLTGQTTGFIALDKKTTGYNKGDLVIIAARPAMGKTAFILNTVLNNLLNGDGVIFFSLEMPETQLMSRMISIHSKVPLQYIKKGQLDEEQKKAVSRTVAQLRGKKLFVDDSGNININQLRSKVRKISQNKENNIKMVVVDYLQLMNGTDKSDRRLVVDEISRGLKLLAREMELPVVALSQLNRGLENRPDKRPMLSDIRESGAIEQDADIIMFVYRDDIYRQKEEKHKEQESINKGDNPPYKSAYIDKPIEDAEIIIGKQRNGETGIVKMQFEKELTRFIDVEYSNMPVIVTFKDENDLENVKQNSDSNVGFNQETNVDFPDNLV